MLSSLFSTLAQGKPRQGLSACFCCCRALFSLFDGRVFELPGTIFQAGAKNGSELSFSTLLGAFPGLGPTWLKIVVFEAHGAIFRDGLKKGSK